MSWLAKLSGAKEDEANLELTPELEQTLEDFRQSIHAWSAAAYARPRTVAEQIEHRSWRLAVGWAMAMVLVVSSVGGGYGIHVRHRQQEFARIAATERANQLKLVAEQQEKLQSQAREQRAQVQNQAQKQQNSKQAQASTNVETEDLLAEVDSDISRQVPSAMEPLAQMMSGDETR
jgi:hypothetical protein